MRGGDIDFALKLTAREDWGFVRGDFQRFLDLSPEGCLVATTGGKRVGLAVLFLHGGSAWIGSVIVSDRCRRMGIGQELLRTALRVASRRRARWTGLLSYENTIRFYSSLGFSRGGCVQGWRGRPALERDLEMEEDIAEVTDDILPEVLRLDGAASGVDRSAMLRRFAEDFRSTFLVHREFGMVQGFIVGKGGGDCFDIGPWVALKDRPEVAIELLLSLRSRIDAPMELHVPDSTEGMEAVLVSLGFQKTRAYIEMFRGPGPAPGERAEVISIAGLEKG